MSFEKDYKDFYYFSKNILRNSTLKNDLEEIKNFP